MRALLLAAPFSAYARKEAAMRKLMWICLGFASACALGAYLLPKGARFLNNKGEDFMQKYSPVSGPRPIRITIRAA